MNTHAQAATTQHQEMALPQRLVDQARARAARLLRARSDEVAFIGPTSLALSLVAGSLPLQAGDNIVVYADDYPSNVYPWLAWPDRGVEVRTLKTAELGRIEPDDVLHAVDGRTRLVALSTVHYLSGYRIDVETIGQMLRERGIWFCLDAIQSLGAFPLEAHCADFVAAGGHKWLLGPCGTGLLYVRREVQEQLRPQVYGWHNILCPDYVTQDKIDYAPGIQRFECGTANLVGLVGLSTAIQLLLDIGIEKIADQLTWQRAYLGDQLRSDQFTVALGDAGRGCGSGITSFTRTGVDLAELHQRLHNERIVTSLRKDRTGRQWLRLSPHFYVEQSAVQRVVSLLAAHRWK